MQTASRRIRRGTLGAFMAAALAALATAAVALPGGSADDGAWGAGDRSAKPFLVLGLTDDQKLVAFRSDSPRRVQKLGRVDGLVGDGSLIGIDRRAKDGALYGVGDQGGVYTIRLKDGQATKVSQLTVALQGTSFDIDWNPAADLLRVISDTGQNLRHNVDNAASPLAVGQTATDTALSIPTTVPTATGVTGAAYTNNDNDPATATTLFVLDPSRDQVAVQSPANAGLLVATGLLGVAADGDAGFDIRAQGNQGLATLQVDGRRALYQVDVLTGEADRIGSFPGDRQVVDLTVGF